MLFHKQILRRKSVKSLQGISIIHWTSVCGFGLMIAVLPLFLTVVIPSSAQAQNVDPKKPAIILVHGAFADGSSWSKVIPMLQAKGYRVTAVQNPLTSLADDVAATNRVINQQTEPVILVGHSWAGVVITEAGNNPKVSSLVYVSALAPDSGQSIVDAVAGFPPAPYEKTLIKDEGGFLWLPPATIATHFAQDLTPVEQGVIAATQVPWYSGCLTDKVTNAAWRDKPSRWVIGEKDLMVSPALQAKMADNIKAKITRVQTSHVAMLADPKAVTAVIIDAATAKTSSEKSGSSQPALTDGAGINTADFNQAKVVPSKTMIPLQTAKTLTARDVLGTAAVVPLTGEAPPKIIIDQPLAESLAAGRVVIQYRAENLRILPVYGASALDVSPRIGHIHVTVDDGPWRWVDASGEPLIINKLPPGPHKILIELVNANHQTLDRGIVNFVVPQL
jgi:pimeloyl-ACP methyl ester carboxylesterase